MSKRLLAVKATRNELLATAQWVGKTKLLYCGLEACARAHYRANLCRAHYQQYWLIKKEENLGRIEIDRSLALKHVQPPVGSALKAKHAHCHVPGCSRQYMGRGLCRTHYKQWYKATKGN